MNDVFKSIYSLFSTAPHNSFYNALEGRLAYSQAPQDWVDNYAVYSPITIINDDTFDAYINDLSIQFSIFSSDRSTCGEMVELCIDLYNNTLMTVTGHCPVKIIRENTIPMMLTPNELLWFGGVDFTMKYQRT